MKALPALVFLTCVLAAGARAAELTVAVKNGKGEALADAVLSLVPLEAAQPLPAPAPGPAQEIVQQNQEFSPYVTVVQAGGLRLGEDSKIKPRGQVKVRLLPCRVTASTTVCTMVLTEALLFALNGSVTAELTLTVLVTVPPTTP